MRTVATSAQVVADHASYAAGLCERKLQVVFTVTDVVRHPIGAGHSCWPSTGHGLRQDRPARRVSEVVGRNHNQPGGPEQSAVLFHGDRGLEDHVRRGFLTVLLESRR